jgi:hypothetical protein
MAYKRPLCCWQAFGIKNKIAKIQANQFFHIFQATNLVATNLGHESLATNLWVAGGASPAAIAITSPLGSPSWNGLQIVTVRGLCGDSMGMPSRNDAKIGTVGSGQVNPRHMAIVSDFFKSQNQTYSDMPACTGFNGPTAVSKAYLPAPVGDVGQIMATAASLRWILVLKQIF